MDHYVRGMDTKFSWRDVLKTLEDEAAVHERDVAAALARAWPDRCSLQLPMRRISMPVSRRFVRLAAWLVVLLFLPHDSHAQTVEVTPFGGYRVGGGFFDVPNGRVVDDDAAPSVGLLVNVDVGMETPG